MATHFTDEQKAKIKTEVCERISSGETLRAICRDSDKPSWSVMYRWLDDDEEFKSRFAQAREVGADAIATEALEIIDELPNLDHNGNYDKGHIAWNKNRVEARLKLLAKWSPKKYGDKLDLTSSDKSMTPTNSVDASKLSTAALAELLAAANESTEH